MGVMEGRAIHKHTKKKAAQDHLARVDDVKDIVQVFARETEAVDFCGLERSKEEEVSHLCVCRGALRMHHSAANRNPSPTSNPRG